MRSPSTEGNLVLVLVLVFDLDLVSGCDEKKPATVVDAGAVPTTTPPPKPTAAAAPLPKCRVMASENGLPPSADPTKWVDLPEKSITTVRVLETGREIRFEGAGRARPCADDYAILTGGSVSISAGGAEGPGSDAWIATPCGVVRIAGSHKVTVERNVCRVEARLGPAFVYSAHDARLSADAGAIAPDGWARIDAPKTVELRFASTKDRVAAAMERCTHVVSDATDIANRMLDGGSTAALAAQSVLARRAARASCATAAAIAGAAHDPVAELAAASAFQPLR